MCAAPSNLWNLCTVYAEIYTIKCYGCEEKKMHLYVLMNLPSNVEVILGYSKRIYLSSYLNTEKHHAVCIFHQQMKQKMKNNTIEKGT